jgi:hypothetical protein
VRALHHFSLGLRWLLEEAVERVVMGASHGEKTEKRRRRPRGGKEAHEKW